MWLDGVLNGSLEEQYAGQAQLQMDEIAAANGKAPEQDLLGGTPFMAPDGL